MEYQVTVSDHALEDMVLAASESFVLGDARTWDSVEIHGYLWGSRRTQEGVEYVHVDKFSVSVSAWGDEDSVSVDKRVALLKDSVLGMWIPHCHFLGMFHTHPYESLTEVNDNKGWEFSDGDEESFLSDEDSWELARPGCPLSMVMAVTKIKNVKDAILEAKDNRIVFNVGELRFWLSAGIGDVSRGQTKTLSTDVSFRPFARYINWAGSRLRGVDGD